MISINPFFLCDGYKVGHPPMYPEGTTLVYSNLTPRSNRYAPGGVDYVVSFYQQPAMQMIYETFQSNFFNKPKSVVCAEIRTEYSMYLDTEFDVSHIEALHDLGYLPIKVKALPEGTKVPMGVPVLTIYNTHPDFFWLTNFLETWLSNILWKPITSATIASVYKKILVDACMETDPDAIEFVNFQAHDFSMRGLDSIDAAISSGLGHATSFLGSDSLPVIAGARKYYGEVGFVTGSVNATEHSVMCAGGAEEGNELATFRHLMKKFPTGILSIVSDTWDLWKVITEMLPILKDEIMARDGKIVIRPDSGDPAYILCGTDWIHPTPDHLKSKDFKEVPRKPSQIGVIELLWDIFGGTTNEKGYKVLDPHIGAIYGDSITIDRAKDILARLKKKGFASTNIVLGVGSFTYQYNTRDTFGFAMKATYVEIDGVGKEIFKDPITDDGTKKSAKGLLEVVKNGDKYALLDQITWKQEGWGQLQTIFHNGEFENPTTLTEIRERLNK